MTEETYTVHNLTTIEFTGYYGLHPDTQGAGLIRATVNSTGQRIALVVDAEYAALIQTAKEAGLDDAILSATQVRWARLGWPEEWTPGRSFGAWAPVYLPEYGAPADGGHGVG